MPKTSKPKKQPSLSRLTNKIFQLKERCTRQNNELQSLQSTIESQEMTIMSLNNALQEQYGSESADLRLELSRFKIDNTQLANSLHSTQSHLHAISVAHTTLQNIYNLHLQQHQQSTQELSELRRVHNSQLDELTDTKQEIQSLQEDNELLLQSVREKQATITTLKESQKELHNVNENYKQETKEQLQKLTALAEEKGLALEAMEEKLGPLMEEADRVKALSDENKMLNQSIEQLRERLGIKKRQAEQFVNMNAEMNMELNKMRLKYEEGEKVIMRMKELNEDKEREIEHEISERKHALEELQERLNESIVVSKELEEGNIKEQENKMTAVQETERVKAEMQKMEKEKDDISKKLKTVEKTKIMMQRTLMHQIYSLREKMKVSDNENEEIIQKSNNLQNEVDRLQILLNAHKRKGKSINSRSIVRLSRDTLREHGRSSKIRLRNSLGTEKSSSDFSTNVLLSRSDSGVNNNVLLQSNLSKTGNWNKDARNPLTEGI